MKLTSGKTPFLDESKWDIKVCLLCSIIFIFISDLLKRNESIHTYIFLKLASTSIPSSSQCRFHVGHLHRAIDFCWRIDKDSGWLDDLDRWNAFCDVSGCFVVLAVSKACPCVHVDIHVFNSSYIKYLH